MKATVALQDVESKERVEAFGYAREPDSRPKMDEAQVTGSSSSYAPGFLSSDCPGHF